MDERERVLLTLAGMRAFMGVYWLLGVVWRLPGDFGGDGRRGLRHALALARDHAFTSPLRSVVDDVLAPHVAPVGWVLFLLGLATGLSLLLGLLTRLGALLGLVHAIASTLLLGGAPGEWLYGYLMLVLLSALLLLLPVSRRLSLDDALGRDP
jgi:hypothetical protein